MNQINMRFPGGRVRAFTMSYDDGVEQDVRLISIMKKRGVKGTFNLNSGLYAPEGTVYPAGQVHRRMTRDMCLKTYDSELCEVAVHGSTHPFWNRMPAGARAMDIIRDRVSLENGFKRIVRGAAYPYGCYDEATVEALRSAGIVYCRTVHSTHSFDLPRNWLTLDPTCHHDDPKLDELVDRFLNLSGADTPRLFYLWGHSYEFEQKDNWQVIENCLDRVGGLADVWYATNIEIYDYVKAYEALVFSAEGTTVFNPTGREIWLCRDGITYAVNSGECRQI